MDGLGHVVHENLFAVEIRDNGEPELREPGALGNFSPAPNPGDLPALAAAPEPSDWMQEHALTPFLEETRAERTSEVARIASHVELSLTELLQRADEEIGRAAADAEDGKQGAEGRLAMAESRHAELFARRERRRQDLERQRSLSPAGGRTADQRVGTAPPRAGDQRGYPTAAELGRLRPSPWRP